MTDIEIIHFYNTLIDELVDDTDYWEWWLKMESPEHDKSIIDYIKYLENHFYGCDCDQGFCCYS